MSKTRDTGYLANVIQVHDTGVRIMSGSEMLMAISSSGAVTITGELSGSDAANSLLLNGTGSVGFTTTGSFSTASGSASSRLTQIENVYATTGSNSFRATQSITGSLTVTGQITAQTLNVQQVTSSIVYSSGSNVFGCDLNSRQTFTGSFYQTGSFACFSNNIKVGANTTITSGNVTFTGYPTSLCLGNGQTIYDNSVGGLAICSNGNIQFETSGSNRFNITSGGVACFGGQVCVGNASIATRSLVVQAGSTNQAIMFKNASGGDATLYICGNATATHYGFNTYACADVLFIANGGSIGIGCNNPGYTLDVNGNGHFRAADTTMLIESTQPTNATTLKVVQCANGGNGNTDQGLVVQTNAGDGSSNIAHFYDYNSGTALSRLVIKRNGNTIIGCSVSAGAKLDVWGNIRSYDAPTYYSTLDYFGGAYLEMSSPSSETADNFVFNICGGGGSTTGNCFIFRTQAGNTTPSQVFGINKNGVAIFSGQVCTTSQFKGGSLYSSQTICGSGFRSGAPSGNSGGYTSDGLWGGTATPNYIYTTSGMGLLLGYKDNGSGLYGAAYGFDVSYRDGLNNPIDYDAIIMRNSGQGTTPFRVTSYGNIYGNTKNFRIKHPIPSMNDTHYLVHTSIEGPQADLIYRGKAQLENGKIEVNIDEASKMTNGTFELLCQDVQSYTTNESGWTLIKSYIVGNILHIEAQDETSNDTISWLVIGERNDEGIKNSAITDENGHVIVEEIKQEEV